ncbi:hypothetical protein KUCAC02_000194 [Chaenocephalus aceratus]|uniref:Uncharacterized protein n=1 Tax=Chaenocephalus aceratus TaxID=36190 RepID=A0ACB9W637_CHAAC|nr:hypothetical protein KUCAC02_000194 [Chaenocephalus aceratus]
MRGDATKDNEMDAADEHGGSAEAATGERRSSIEMLQNMLKRVSQNPFQSQYSDDQFLIDLAAAADVTDKQQLNIGRSLVQETPHLNPQNGVSGGLARSNPFYTNDLGSGPAMEDERRKTSEAVNLEAIFVPPPEFQSSPLDLQPERSTENGTEFSELPKDLFQTVAPNRVQSHFQTPTSAQNASANDHFLDKTLNLPDIFKPVPSETRDEGVDLFQAAKGDDLFHATCKSEVNLFKKPSSVFEDPFESPTNREEDLFQSSQPNIANPPPLTEEADLIRAVLDRNGERFHIGENKQDSFMKEDLFGMSSFKENLDVFSPSSTNSVDPFPSPITRDLFQDGSSLEDPFGTTPVRSNDPFQDVSPWTPDIFQPLPSKTNSMDVFGMTFSNTAPKAVDSTSSVSSPSDMKLDMLSSPDLFKTTAIKAPPPAVMPKPSIRQHGIILTTPQGSTHDILQPSPFSRARNLSMTPSQSAAEKTHVSNFKRPPKPLPRARPPRTEKTPLAVKLPKPERPPPPTNHIETTDKPEKPERPPAPANPIAPEAIVPKTSPKPAFRPLSKPTLEETKEFEKENFSVFEDILLMGQERCIEDWPEDSPQLNPQFRPSGTLRLRRESMRIKLDSEGGSAEDLDGFGVKKKAKKFRLSILSRRSSKISEERRSSTLPTLRRSSKEYSSETNMSTEENEDSEQYGMDCKKKNVKTKVNKLLRRASANSSVLEGKQMNGHLPQDLKAEQIRRQRVSKKESTVRRWSEGTALDGVTGEEEEEEEEEEEDEEEEEEELGAQHKEKKKKKMKIKFVAHRGFAITVEKKGAHGYTPRKDSKVRSQDELFGAHGYTPRKKSQDDAFEDVERRHALHSTSKAAYMDDKHFQKTRRMSAGFNGDEDPYEMEDCKPKKPTTTKMLQTGRRSSKENMLDFNNAQKKKGSFSAEELDDDEWVEYCKPKPSKKKGLLPVPRKSAKGQREATGFSQKNPQQAASDPFAEDDFTKTGKDVMCPGETYYSEEGEVDTCKPKKKSKLKGFKKHKPKSKANHPEYEDPAGATSADFLSEAARAEWLAAQVDEQALEELEDDLEDGDTDSLMEWWHTVEQWDEVPSDDEYTVLKEDESKSFTNLADKVQHGLRVFNKIFTERAEFLWQSILRLHAIADNINTFHHKAKIASITGGTTTAVGGVAAIAGLALAPFTFGASLVITAVGVGVATAGGIASASAAISDNVHNLHDRKKVEIVLGDYEAHLLAIGKILHFVNHGLIKLRGHPFLRSGTQHYSKDWEIRRAVQMISLVDKPVMRGTETTDELVASVQGLFTGMDKYFAKDTRELKKGCKKEVVCQIKEVANVLNVGIVELNSIREELQDATGNM